MTEIPESKQKRLMSLNQDVLAVSADTPAARERERIQASSDGAGIGASTQARSGPRSSLPGVLLVVLALAGLAAGMFGLWTARQVEADLALLATAASGPDEQVEVLAQRLAEMESRLEVAGQETDKMDDQSQASLLQANARLRKVGAELSRLTGELEKLRATVASNTEVATRAEAQALRQASRVTALEREVADIEMAAPATPSAPAPAPVAAPQQAPLSGAEWEQQLIQLNIKVERQASEIRNLSRKLDGE